MNRIITIDGPAGSGKSTVSRHLARKLNLLYLDTGAMYRAVALQAKRNRIDFTDGKGLGELSTHLDLSFRTTEDGMKCYLGDEDISSLIRSPEMDMLSSRVSTIKEVRQAMNVLQRKIGELGGLVAEGRDMGTVVFPDADHKFFLAASPEIRVKRRYEERLGRGETIAEADVKKELHQRDHQDQTRALAPLRPAEDAVIIDTTSLNIDQVLEMIILNLEKKK